MSEWLHAIEMAVYICMLVFFIFLTACPWVVPLLYRSWVIMHGMGSFI